MAILDSFIGESADESSIHDYDAFFENLLYDEISRLSDDERKQVMESVDFNALLEANVIGKKTVVRLNKVDDLQRRITIAAYQKAKEDNDPNYIALKKIIAKKKALNEKILQKYGTRVKRDAIKAQKQLLKIDPRAFTKPVR